MPSILHPVVGLASRLAAGVLLGAIALYRLFLSPLLAALTGSGCRFTPSCSAYAAESIRLNGPLHGSRQAVARICRCHPFHPGGHDPPVQTRFSGK